MATETCDRTIIAHNFDYTSALNLIQKEEYLEDEDFDDIRLLRKRERIIQDVDEFEEKVTSDFDYSSYSNSDYSSASDFEYPSISYQGYT